MWTKSINLRGMCKFSYITLNDVILEILKRAFKNCTYYIYSLQKW